MDGIFIANIAESTSLLSLSTLFSILMLSNTFWMPGPHNHIVYVCICMRVWNHNRDEVIAGVLKSAFLTPHEKLLKLFSKI